jgi:hypothetical protein
VTTRPPASYAAASLVRLLASTVEVVTDFEPADLEPVLLGAMGHAAATLTAFATGEACFEGHLDALTATVAALPTHAAEAASPP